MAIYTFVSSQYAVTIFVMKLRSHTKVYPKFQDWVYNEIYAYLRYYSLRNNKNIYAGKTH